MYSLGARIAYLRNKKKMSQEEFSKVLKIGKSTLGMYETDKREPSHEMSAKIAKEFGVSLDWLMTGKEAENDYLPENQTQYVLREMVEKYNVDLNNPGEKEKLEQIIQLVFGDMKNK